MPIYLALKEVWYNKGRFLLIASIVALITTLVLFIAALAEGLGNGNREYIAKLNGELLVYQKNVDLSISASQLGRNTLAAVRRVPGVADVGQVSFAPGELLLDSGTDNVNISLIGVEAGKPGEPKVLEGRQLSANRGSEVLIDINVVRRTPFRLGDTIRIKTTQGVDEKIFELKVVGIADGSQISVAPGLILPFETWEKVRPQPDPDQVGKGALVSNVISVKLENPADEAEMAKRIEAQVDKVQVVDRVTAYENTPGYSAQQSTLQTQRYFTLFIGILVVGGFFQFQTLQKIAQVGMLKAVGVSSFMVGTAALLQIIVVNAFGVLIGVMGTQLLKLGLPPAIPIVFTGDAALTAIGLLMVIGPLGGLVSVILLLRVEPLRALGLAQ
ncbi:MAG: ABC transporter permease [Caldilineaceae bacterium]